MTQIWRIKPETVSQHFEALGECRNVDEFEKLHRIGEGTYGTVYRARDRISNEIVALKRVLLHNESSEGFPITTIREIKLLRRLLHPNCVQLRSIAVGRTRESVFLVFEYCEHDLSLLLKSNIKKNSNAPLFNEAEVKQIMLSLLNGLNYLHSQQIVHRDIKLSNVLYDRYGNVKLADFGLAREFTNIPTQNLVLTPKVVTLWYRAPELLTTDENRSYTTAIDMWSCGCLFAELIIQKTLFRGENEINQLQQIFQVLGAPNDDIWPGFSSLKYSYLAKQSSRGKYHIGTLENLREVLPPSFSNKGLDLLTRLLKYNPSKRLTASEALVHPYFCEKPFPQDASMMPTFPSLHSEMIKKAKHSRTQTSESYNAFEDGHRDIKRKLLKRQKR